jgi:hypothetical protein
MGFARKSTLDDQTVELGPHFSELSGIVKVNAIFQQRKGVKEKKCVTIISLMW